VASVLTHPAVPLALAVACGQRIVPGRLLLAGIAASVLPDLDALGLGLGIAYGDTLGHRGLSHSILFALLLGAGAARLHRTLRSSPPAAFLVVFISCLSHGLLDACTNGGLGVAFFSPLSNHRYFLPWRPLTVSPLDAGHFLSEWGLRVLRSEALWVWWPCALVGGLGLVVRRGAKRARPAPTVRDARPTTPCN
jgi:inner membrane protein